MSKQAKIEILFKKLNKYKNKFYAIKGTNGIIIFIVIAIPLLIISSLFLYYVNLTAKERAFVHFATLLILAVALIESVFFPLFKILFLNVKRNPQQVVSKIERSDKKLAENIKTVLNLFYKQHNSSLAIAAVNQKIDSLKLIEFNKLLTWKNTLKFIRYLSISLALLAYVFTFHNKEIYIGAQKLINYNREIDNFKPFEFRIINKNLTATQGEDYTIRVKVVGNFLPENLLINIDGNDYLMVKNNTNIFSYTLKNVTKAHKFFFKSDKFKSAEYLLAVKQKPAIKAFEIEIFPPKYTRRPSQKLKNSTNIEVPENSQISILVNISNADSVTVLKNNTTASKILTNGAIKLHDRISKSTILTFKAAKLNLLSIKFNVIKDQYPSITVKQFRDSSKLSLFYFTGKISDDYGFYRLNFIYSTDTTKHVGIQINKSVSEQQFFFSIDFDTIDTQSEIKYHFVIRDNDRFNGYKAATTEINIYTKPSSEEILKELDSTAAESFSSIDKSMEYIRQLQEDIENIKRQLLDQNLSQWQRKSLIENLQRKQQLLEKQMQETKTMLKKKEALLNSYSKNKELLEKQKQINKLYDQLLNDELKKLMKQLNELLKEQNQKDFSKKLNNLQYDYKNLEKNLDRTLELLKRENIKQQINQQVEELKNLAQNQEKLKDKTLKSQKNELNKILDKQTTLKFSLELLKDQYKETIKQNKELERQFNLPQLDSLFDQAKRQMQEAENNLNKKQRKKASKAQQKAEETMKEIAEKMQNAIKESELQLNMEDIETLAKIINDLNYLSFQWENIYRTVLELYINSKEYQKEHLKARKLSSEFLMIKDSTEALAKRIPQITKPTLRILNEIIKNNKEILNLFDAKQKNQLLIKNRQIITNINDLTLLLSDVKKQMEQAMKNAQSSAGSKQKQMQKLDQMQQMQQSLEEQIKQMLEQLKNQGEPKSKDLAEALAKQQMLEKLLEEFMQNETLSPELRKKLNEIQKLNKENQKDFIYKKISPETLLRQQQIKVKLLEAENALKKQQKDKKRKAQAPGYYKKQDPESVLKNYNKKINQKESINYNNVKLNFFFKNYFSKYLNRL